MYPGKFKHVSREMIIEGQEKHSRAVIFKTLSLFHRQNPRELSLFNWGEPWRCSSIAELELIAQVYEANNGTIYL